MRTRFKPLLILVVAVVVVVALLAWPEPTAHGAPLQRASQPRGPVDARTVYWVGHSLLSQRDPRSFEKLNVVESVGALARSQGLAYDAFEQTNWGSPLSLAYRGATHASGRTDLKHAAKRRELLDRGARYDAMVLTDTVPIAAATRWEHSAYYATRFACDLRARSPQARVFLSAGWVHLQGNADEPTYGSPSAWRYIERMGNESEGYALLLARVNRGAVLEPGLMGRALRWLRPAAPCAIDPPALIVPVGDAFARLAERLRGERWEYGGRALTIADLYANPVLALPADWPRDDVDAATARARLRALPRRFADEPLDDIHASALGIYVSALVHYAVLYARSPEGLPALDSGLQGEALAALQSLVWAQVTSDPRTGVAAAR